MHCGGGAGACAAAHLHFKPAEEAVELDHHDANHKHVDDSGMGRGANGSAE
jgi:hypothetical protein